MKQYITYGFVIEDIKDIKTDLTTIGNMKPKSALWGSPVDAEFGWREWCEAENYIPGKRHMSFDEYFKTYFTWTLKDNSKIYTISNLHHIRKLADAGIIHRSGKFLDLIVDYKMAYDMGYSAIELCDSTLGHRFFNPLELLFNSWDCESIVVLDPSKGILLESQYGKGVV